jgi:acylglycerol lipase
MEEIKLKTKDNEEINIYHWKPKKVKETLILLHGLCDHSGWYISFINEFSKNGYEVYAMDRRGCGKNLKNRGDIKDFHIWLNDIQDLIKNQNLKKVSLVGISVGALIALAYSLKHAKDIKDIILFVPAMKNKIKFNIFYELSFLYSSLFKPKSKFKISILENMISDDKNLIKKISKDKLNQEKFSARCLKEIIKMNFYVQALYKKIHVPQIIFLGEDDHVVENNYNIKFFKGNKIVMYKGAQHGLIFGNMTELLDDVINWLEEIK